MWWAKEAHHPHGGVLSSISAKDIIQLLDKSGIDVGIVQGGDFRRTTNHPDFPDEHEVFVPNDYVAAEVKKYPQRIFGQAQIDPLRDPTGAVLELERCVKDLDMRGLKMTPTYQHFYPSDERLDSLYEKCIELDIPVMFHTGWTAIINAPMKFQDPILLDDVGIKFRKLKVIVAHVGHPWVDQGICLVAKHPNFYCDMANWSRLGAEYLAQTILKLKALNSADRILYGSDNAIYAGTDLFPNFYKQVNSFAERWGLTQITDEEMANIMGGTAAFLYKIK
jgi:predicted TIM-barrel fold metal-dependent hydrolase